jgi:hypothetical protein
MYATFNGLFPGIVPRLADIFNVESSVGFVSFATAGPRMAEIKKALPMSRWAQIIYDVKKLEK